MKKSSLFITNLIINALRYAILLILSIIFIIMGALWIDVCLYIGIALLALYFIICLIFAIRFLHMLDYRSDDNPEFNEMMEHLTSDPEDFMAEIIDKYEEKKKLHGKELLILSDDELFETVSFQNLDMAENAETVEDELNCLNEARKVVYCLNLFDQEIQNGGLCQFFVNSSGAVAPYICSSLQAVGATDHLKLFDEFINANHIDVSNLDSFKVHSTRGFIKQTKRFDFDSFDDSYYELPALQEKVAAYIRDNIMEF